MFDSTRSTVAPTPSDQLLGPGSQRLKVALLSARTAAVLRRLTAGVDIDELDQQTLGDAEAVMRAAAEAVSDVEAGGSLRPGTRSLGYGAMALAVESTAAKVKEDELEAHLRSIADSLASINTTADAALVAQALDVFSALADLAVREVGSVGESKDTLV